MLSNLQGWFASCVDVTVNVMPGDKAGAFTGSGMYMCIRDHDIAQECRSICIPARAPPAYGPTYHHMETP